MSTRAIAYLKRYKIHHETVSYDHRRKGAAFAAEATGFPLEQTVKTLVVAFDKDHYVLALMTGEKQVDFKKLARHAKTKKADMADAEEAERLTGYQVGGISPFGAKRPLPVFMDESILKFDHVLINAGQRGLMLKMATEDIRKALNCTVMDMAKKDQLSP